MNSGSSVYSHFNGDLCLLWWEIVLNSMNSMIPFYFDAFIHSINNELFQAGRWDYRQLFILVLILFTVFWISQHQACITLQSERGKEERKAFDLRTRFYRDLIWGGLHNHWSQPSVPCSTGETSNPNTTRPDPCLHRKVNTTVRRLRWTCGTLAETMSCTSTRARSCRGSWPRFRTWRAGAARTR